jgi:acetyltransferase
MTRLIAVARHYRVGELFGEVLRENRPMLAMCRELGFTLSPDPDPGIVQVRKRLDDPGT